LYLFYLVGLDRNKTLLRDGRLKNEEISPFGAPFNFNESFLFTFLKHLKYPCLFKLKKKKKKTVSEAKYKSAKDLFFEIVNILDVHITKCMNWFWHLLSLAVSFKLLGKFGNF
jgi:hypothetical protein